jgi:hypothetical protein
MKWNNHRLEFAGMDNCARQFRSTIVSIKAGHGCTLRLPGSLPAGIFRKKSIPGSAGILSHGSPGPTGILPAGHRSTGIKGTCRYSVVKTLRIS